MQKMIMALIAGSLSLSAFGAAYPVKHSKQPLKPFYYNYYVGALGGYAYTHYRRSWLTDRTGFTSVGSVGGYRDYAARAFLGYEFNHFVAVEIGAVGLQPIEFNNVNASGLNAEMNQYIVDFVGKLMLPLGSHFRLYGKVGGAYVHRTSFTVNGVNYSSNNKYVPVVSPGFQINFNENFAMLAEYDRYIKSGDLPRTDFYGIGLLYKFT